MVSPYCTRLVFQQLPGHLARMALFKVYTGCRDQEVCGLRWEWEVEVPELELKHTFGRRLRAAGASFEDRQDLLGHRSGRIHHALLVGGVAEPAGRSESGVRGKVPQKSRTDDSEKESACRDPVGMAQDLAASGCDLPSLMQAGRWSTATMPSRYTEALEARRGAVARFYGLR